MQKTYRVDDLCELLDIGKRQAYKLANQPDFPSIRIGGSIRIPIDAFNDWLDEQAAKDTSKPENYRY